MSTALIIIDLIEDIVGKNSLSKNTHQQAYERNVINNSNKAAAFAREHKIPVIWVKVGFADDYHDIPAGSPMFHNIKELGALKLSGTGCNWVNELDVQFHDLVMIKKGVSAFAGNTLNQWLDENKINHVIFGGVSSVMTIQSSVRFAHDLGYQVTVIEDLCSADTLELHQQSMQALRGMAKISSLSDLMQGNIV
ncbi:cysteine hydrolase family protein [Providencia burhodogranariea]|uniref:Isochorismatase hydrolase n=1 Tax=Providencia burhodogranariea DSM 19968 TaxID=1141662 RepID=K8WTG9_9GAMM|nr:cysteine hydrolase [Providencia burhodogranariea]EKT63924.1 isochorismatase hydrolase [Providencia burhodogranariea DSM 19968]